MEIQKRCHCLIYAKKNNNNDICINYQKDEANSLCCMQHILISCNNHTEHKFIAQDTRLGSMPANGI